MYRKAEDDTHRDQGSPPPPPSPTPTTSRENVYGTAKCIYMYLMFDKLKTIVDVTKVKGSSRSIGDKVSLPRHTVVRLSPPPPPPPGLELARVTDYRTEIVHLCKED